MPGKTNTDRIIELLQLVERLETQLVERTVQFRKTDEEQQADIKALERSAEAFLQKLAAVEERCAALQRTADRTWAVWLALIVAGIGLLISLLKR